jgi:hypothetical protein
MNCTTHNNIFDYYKMRCFKYFHYKKNIEGEHLRHSIKQNCMKYLSVLLIAFIFSISLYSQDCTDYHQYHCPYGDYTFFYSRQSKSALFKRGQTSQLKIVVYGGEDYYIAVCAHRKFGDLHFRVLEDTPGENVIYDNADNNYDNSVIISNEITRNLIVEVTVPEGEGDKNDRRCVGVVIQFRKTDYKDIDSGKLGF